MKHYTITDGTPDEGHPKPVDLFGKTSFTCMSEAVTARDHQFETWKKTHGEEWRITKVADLQPRVISGEETTSTDINQFAILTTGGASVVVCPDSGEIELSKSEEDAQNLIKKLDRDEFNERYPIKEDA
tara:strand:- start:99 stop:485 length:387 start_codon:yes stop_codon:yes gene_type:complete